MPAMLMDNSRHANAALVREGVEGGKYAPVTAKVTMTHAASTETAEDRRARHAKKTGTRRGMWK